MVKYYNDKPLGRLGTDRYDFQDHIDGYSFRQNATTIDLQTPITINSILTDTVEEAVINLNDYIGSITSVPDATASVKGILKLTTDLGGTAALPNVVGIRGVPISATVPSTNDILQYNGSNWIPTAITSNFTAAGDLAGTVSNQTVIGLTGTRWHNSYAWEIYFI